MVDKKGKRPRAAAAAEEEAGPAGRVAMKKLRVIQQELKKINNKSKENLLEVKKQYKEKLKPVYSRRAEVIDKMPNFWLTMILRHRKLDNVLMLPDWKIFDYFESLNVEELELPRNGYCITFTFKENPYFENEKLTKTVAFSDNKTLSTIGTTIIWKDGYDVLTRRHYHQNSFFNWFSTPKEEVEHDLGFTKLITLDFQEVDFVPAAFEHFISLCLVLERELVGCTSFDSFEVEAPCLKFFSFQGVFKCIHFKNSPALAEVSLGIHMAVVGETPMREGFEYFQFVSTLQTLYLHPRVLEFMGAGDQFPESFNSLKYLDVSMYLDSVNEISSPSQELPSLTEASNFCMEVGVESVMGFIRGQETPDVELNHIRRVRIAVFASVGDQIEFVRYVLAAAAKLEELVISLAFSAAIPDHALMEQLRRLPRAWHLWLSNYVAKLNVSLV